MHRPHSSFSQKHVRRLPSRGLVSPSIRRSIPRRIVRTSSHTRTYTHEHTHTHTCTLSRSLLISRVKDAAAPAVTAQKHTPDNAPFRRNILCIVSFHEFLFSVKYKLYLLCTSLSRSLQLHTHRHTKEAQAGRLQVRCATKKKCPLHTHNCGTFLVNSRTRFLQHAGRGRRSTQESVTSSVGAGVLGNVPKPPTRYVAPARDSETAFGEYSSETLNENRMPTRRKASIKYVYRMRRRPRGSRQKERATGASTHARPCAIRHALVLSRAPRDRLWLSRSRA